MKDPYMFDFIEYRKGMIEREIESELVKILQNCCLNSAQDLHSSVTSIRRRWHPQTVSFGTDHRTIISL